ncbi:MAG: apolipoprotein N-acyltransferase [Spirochaetota bacterium]
MKELKWHLGISLAVASALLLLLSFPPFNVNSLGFIALVPLFFLVYNTNLKKTICYGIAGSFLFYCLYLFWMNAYLAVIGVGFVTVVYGGWMVLALALINLSARAFPRYRVVLTPFIWIAIEYARSFGFLGLTFGSIGYTQHNFLRFIQTAEIGGEPLVSFIVVLFNAGVAGLVTNLVYNKRILPSSSLPLFACIGLIIFSLVYGSVKIKEPIPQKPSLKLSLVQALSSPRIEWSTEKWKTLERLTSLTKKSYQENPDVDLIVWTETAIRTSLRPNLIYGTPYHHQIERLIQKLGTHFVIGSPDNYKVAKNPGTLEGAESLSAVYPVEGEIWTNSAYFLDPHASIVKKYDKIQLTPFGEHFPLGEKLPFLQKILDKFTDSAGFTPGRKYTVFEQGKLDFSVVICWEGTYSYLIRRFIRNGADFIINISNDMWTGSRAGHFQHFTITKFRAIENRIWFARGGNDGVTAIINPHGRVVKILPIKKEGYLTGTIGPRARQTFFTRYGNILPRISLVVLGISFVFSVIILTRSSYSVKTRKNR